MSWFNLKKFLPPRKLWKVFKKKLPLKLHKLSRSNAKKNISYKTSTKLVWPTSHSVQPKNFKKTKNRVLIHHRNRNHKYQKPVFVDQLFLEKEIVHTPDAAVKGSASMGKSRTVKGGDQLFCKSAIGDRDTVSADDMWESMVIGSPHMHEIDERAEEFIARIKAEMRHQEMMARR